MELDKSMKAIEIDKKNGSHIWWNSLMKEIKIVRSPFEIFQGKIESLIGYQEVKRHLVQEAQLSKNARPDQQQVDALLKRDRLQRTLQSLQEIWYESLAIAALNWLDVLGCDMQNAYIPSPCREKICIWIGYGQDSDCS